MMPDDIAARACHDGERVDAHAMHGYQSAWMAHWKHANCKSANHFSVGCELKEVKEKSDAKQLDLLGGLDVALDSSVHTTGAFGEAAEATRVAFIDDAETGKSKKASCDSESFPIFNLSRKLNGRLSLQREEKSVCREEDGNFGAESCSGDDDVSLNRDGSHLPSTSAHAAPSNVEILAKEGQLLSQGVLMKSPCAVEQKNLAVSTPMWNDFVKSASDIVPTNGRDKGKTVMPQFTGGPHEVYLASQEHYMSTKCHGYASLFIREKKMSTLLDPQRSPFPIWMQGGIAHFPHDPIAGSDDGLYFVRGQHHKIQNYIASPNITNETALLESTKPQIFYGASSLVAQVPCPVLDVESMKMYASIDSIEESSRGHPKISQATHHFLMPKKTDVNLSDRGQFFRESVAPSTILDLSPPISDPAVEGLKLENLGSSRKNEGKENVQYFKCPTSMTNESSAETDTMDIDALHENNLSGEVPSQTNKCSKDGQNSLTSQIATTSAGGKTIVRLANIVLPDINKEPGELLTLASPVVDRETSTSRTHSLDAEQLFSHADGHARSKSSSSSLGPDPTSRWVKRLKLCRLDSAHGTKSEKIGETSPHEKASNISSKIMKDSKTSLEAKMVSHAKEQMLPDLPATVLSNDRSSFTEANKTVEITLSHPWIQRWSHNRDACSTKRHELAELREPKSSNTMPEEFQKEQFPSIGAMALMGKAMNSLNPSELMKKGSVMVWNTKGY